MSEEKNQVKTALNNNMSLTPRQLKTFVKRIISKKNSKGMMKQSLPPFIWGAPGIGKTEIVRQIAEERRSRLVAMHLPQYDPTDIKGIPVKCEGDVVRWVASSYLPQEETFLVLEERNDDGTVVPKTEYMADFINAVDVAVYMYDREGNEIFRYNDPDPDLEDVDNCGIGATKLHRMDRIWTVEFENAPDPNKVHKVVMEDKAVLFLDELSAAETTTQNAALQLVLDKKLNEYGLPNSTVIIAAGNREDDGAFVQGISHPLCNRFIHYTLIPSADDWIDWALDNQINPNIVGFIKFDVSAIHRQENDSLANGNFGFPTPRTWKFLSDQYEDIDYYNKIVEEDFGKANHKKALNLQMIDFSGLVGPATARQFRDYLSVVTKLPSPEEIMEGRAKPFKKDVKFTETWGLLYSLGYHLKNAYDTYYDSDKTFENQDPEWKKRKGNIFKFIIENYDDELASWFYAMIRDKQTIPISNLRGGPEFASFCDRFSETVIRVRRAV